MTRTSTCAWSDVLQDLSRAIYYVLFSPPTNFLFSFSRVFLLRCLGDWRVGWLVGRGYTKTMRGVQIVKYISPESIIALGDDAHVWSQGPSAFADTMARSRYTITGVAA